MPLKTFRRIAVAVIVVALTIAAAIGITIIISGDFGELESKVMLTTATIGAFGIVSLCYLAAVGAARPVAWVGFPIAVITFAVAIVLIWRPAFVWTGIVDDQVGPTESDYQAYERFWERWWRTLGVGLVLSLATAHASLLLRLITRRQVAVRLVVGVTVALAAVVSVLQIVPIVADDFDPGDGYWRTLAAAYILLVLGTIVSPVVGLLLRGRPAGEAAPDVRPLTLDAELSQTLRATAAAAGRTPEEHLRALLDGEAATPAPRGIPLVSDVLAAGPDATQSSTAAD